MPGIVSIVLPPVADLKAPAVDSVRDVLCEEDMERKAELERAMSRMLVFVVTVIPSLLAIAAWMECK